MPSLLWYSAMVSRMSKPRSLLLCLLRPIELTSSGWPLVAASCLIVFSGSSGEEGADGDADDQQGRDRPGPAHAAGSA